MLRIGPVLLCMMLIVVGCKPQSQENTYLSQETDSDSVDVVTENMPCDYYYEDTIPFALPGESVDCPDNLVAYGDSLLSGIDSLSFSSADETMTLYGSIKKAFAELERYKTGKRKYYPKKDICNILSDLQIYLTFLVSHSDDLNNDIINVFFRLMEQSVRFCPDINLLSGVCSKDHYIGTLDFYEENGYIMYYSLIYRKPNSQYGVLSLKGNGDKINFIRMIEETDTYRRYLVSVEQYNGLLSNSLKVWVVDLFSNGGTRVIIPSNARTMTEEWNKQIEICAIKGDTAYTGINELYKDAEIVFNPRYIRWSYCNLKDGIFYPVENSKSICLDMDEDSAYFSIQ